MNNQMNTKHVNDNAKHVANSGPLCNAIADVDCDVKRVIDYMSHAANVVIAAIRTPLVGFHAANSHIHMFTTSYEPLMPESAEMTYKAYVYDVAKNNVLATADPTKYSLWLGIYTETALANAIKYRDVYNDALEAIHESYEDVHCNH